MSFEISLTIPEDSQRGQVIASLAAERHITPNEAVERIIDLAAQTNLLGSEQETPAAIVARARAQKAQEPRTLSPPGTEESIVGLFANDPDAVQAIRDASAEGRQGMYESRVSALSDTQQLGYAATCVAEPPRRSDN